ncbi:MAG: vWA domain-containing protein [Planctomycetota bacterium]
MRALSIALSLLVLLAEPSHAASLQRQRDAEAPLTRRESVVRLGQYRSAQHWSVKGIVLSGLGASWHPEAAAAIADALSDRDERLHALGLEALRKMDDEALRMVATGALVEVLVKESLQEKNKLFAARVQEVLARIFPDATADSRSEWQGFWHKLQPTYAPPAWRGPADPTGEGRSAAATAADRALDLSTAGLEICFAIDATGSMQPLLDTVVTSAQEMSDVLAGFASDLRLATVIYRDLGDMPGGSDVVEPLTKNLAVAYKALGKVVAGGGGDIPEAIDAGLEHALSLKDVGWTPAANKLIIVMGDAPAHDDGLTRALDLARQASTDLGVRAGSVDQRRKLERTGRKVAPRSGEKLEGRPFVVSCIAAMHARGGGGGGGPQQDRNQVASHMRQIAEAGKGTYGELEVGVGEDAQASGARQLVQMVVRMSFGSKYDREVQRFLDVYFEYREAKLY